MVRGCTKYLLASQNALFITRHIFQRPARVVLLITLVSAGTAPQEAVAAAGWNAMGTGVNSIIYSLAVSGSDVYAGGLFTSAGGNSANRIAKWDGSSWSAMGTGMTSTVFAIADDGSYIYAGGAFNSAGGVANTSRIARWNGSAWSALGTGMEIDTTVYALAVSGGDLYAGGTFTSAGGVSASRIAKWNGSEWSPLGSGMDDTVYALAVSGGDLYASGAFTTAGGVAASRIAKWNGSEWSALGSGMDNTVYTLAVIGGDLYAGGIFTSAGGVSASRIAKWNGSTWSAMGSGMNNTVRAFDVINGDLYAGGYFTTVDGVSASRIAKWNGSAWSALGSGTDNTVFALAINSDGSNVYAGGMFPNAGGVAVNNIARWEQAPTAVRLSSFTARASGVSPPLALLEWETASELDNAGFHLWRADETNDHARITNGMIPAEGGVTYGASYRFEDRNVSPGDTYFYQLEDIDTSGASTFHGPISVFMGNIALLAPADGSVVRAKSPPAFAWEGVPYDRFRLQFSKAPDFSGTVLTLPASLWITGFSYLPDAAEWRKIKQLAGRDGRLLWRVYGADDAGHEQASGANSLRIQ